MKKVILIAAGTLMALNAANAQTNTKKAQYTSLGPVAGFGHSWVDNMKDQEFKPSAYLGIGLLYSKYEHWAWGANLTASHEGFRNTYTINGQEYTNNVDATYLRFTPRAYYFFGDYRNTVRPKVFLGPSVGVKVMEDNYSDDVPVNYAEGATMVRVNNSDYFRAVDFGAEAGAGLNVKLMRSTWLNLDASYYHGLVNATKDDGMNRNVRVNAGLMFGL